VRSLSNSELSEIEEVVTRLGELVSALPADAEGVSRSTACELLTQASRLYAAGPDPYTPEALAALRVSPTEACTVAAALLHAHSLTPFEFGVWFSNSRVGASDR
jgi:hypothetical protein